MTIDLPTACCTAAIFRRFTIWMSVHLQCSQIRPRARCQQCRKRFDLKRRNKKFCSEKCRKQHWQVSDRASHRKNSSDSKSKRRDNYELFDSILFLTERYRFTPTVEREAFIEDLIRSARQGAPRLRAAFTNPFFLQTEPGDLFRKFLRRNHLDESIVNIADRYCRKKHGSSLRQVCLRKT